MSRERNKESFILDNIENQVLGRSSAPATQASKFEQFTLVMNEIFPLVNDAMGIDGSFEDKKARLISNVHAQSALVDELSDYWGFDQDKILGGKSRSILGRSISNLISQNDVSDPDSVIGLCNVIDETVNDHPFVKKIALDVGVLDSDDVLVSLRLASFPGIYSVRSIFMEMGMDEDEQRTHIGFVFSAAIALSRDIAYNYDPAGTIWDRERLFISALPHCIDFCREAWIELACQDIQEEIPNDDIDVLIGLLVKTQSSVEEVHMGYDNVNHSRKLLFERMIKGVSPYLNENLPKGHPGLCRKIIAYRITEIDEALSDSWVRATDSLISKFEAMSEEDQEKFLETEGDQPMSLDEFWGIFQERMISKYSLLPDFGFDQSDVIGIAGKRLVALWGMADSICKIRKVSV